MKNSIVGYVRSKSFSIVCTIVEFGRGRDSYRETSILLGMFKNASQDFQRYYAGGPFLMRFINFVGCSFIYSLNGSLCLLHLDMI